MSADDSLPQDLKQVDLEELLNLDLIVTSAAKKEQRLNDVASAMFVLTQEDIQRSAARTIPDLLRLVPGVWVAQSSSHGWGIAIRGFNETFNNKLLVMIDGNSIVTPFFNGVHWETLDLVVEDIERIEIIRGPGAALWGGRAVNGVINIITKKSSDTQGLHTQVGFGTENQISTTLRYGDKVSENTTYRVYGKFNDYDDLVFEDGSGAEDDWNIASLGFKAESRLGPKDFLSIWSHGYFQEENLSTSHPTLEPPFVANPFFDRRQRGSLTNISWKRQISEESDFELGVFHKFEYWDDFITPYQLHNVDIDFEHRFPLAQGQEFIYGVGYNFYIDDTKGTFIDDFDPSSRTLTRFKGFFHDDITLVPETLRLILGSRFEYNEQTNFEYMPNIRVIWTPNDKSALWAAVSRTSGTVSRVLEDVIVPVAVFPSEESELLNIVTLFGNRDVDAEELIAYEIGYRNQFLDTLYASITAFFFDYDSLGSVEPGEPFVGTLRDQEFPAVIIPLDVANRVKAESIGVEVSIDWRATEFWTLATSLSYINIDAMLGDSADVAREGQWEDAPEIMYNISSALNPFEDVKWDVVFRYVDDQPNAEIDSYAQVDTQLAWQVTPELELSVLGRNLADGEQLEFLGDVFPPAPTLVERSVFFQAQLDLD